MEDQDYILFDSYINNELSETEILAFKNRLKTDKVFAESFNIYKEANLFLKNKFENEAETTAFKNNLKSISNTHFKTTKTKSETPKQSKLFRLGQFAIAASVAVFLGLFIYNQVFSKPGYTDYNTHEPMTVVRGNVKTLIEATKAFNNKDYKKANTLLKQVLEKDPENRELQLYYAITNIELDNFTIADTQLKALINGQSAYKNRALWYAALSKLKQNSNDASIMLLKQIPAGADDYKEAQRLLDKLE